MLQVDIDFEIEPIGTGKDGKMIFFRDIWPSSEEVANVSYSACFILIPRLKLLGINIVFIAVFSSGCTIKCAA